MSTDSAVPSLLNSLPPWYPAWARELAELYFSGTTCLFILHGNVHDLMRLPGPGGDSYTNLSEFLASQVFGSWNVILHHDMGRGLRPMAGGDATRLGEMVRDLTSRLGEPSSWPRDADAALHVIDRLLERNLLEESPEKRKSIAVVLEYAQYLVPAGGLATLAGGQAARLVKLLGWAQNPYLKRVNTAFCLITEKLAEVSERLVQNPHVATVAIPLPDRADREAFVKYVLSKNGALPAAPLAEGGALAVAASKTAAPPTPTSPLASEVSPVSIGPSAESRVASDSAAVPATPPTEVLSIAQLADVSSGLNLVSLNVLVSQARQSGRRLELGRFRQLKKALIERECQGLVEFVEPPHSLEMVVGHEAALERLKADADYISRGKFDLAPMGYLIVGPVGTGKTFLAEAYAGNIGIPCVKLRNFRSKYVGETEGNLEHVLNVLRSLGPVVVIVDEADASLGNRRAEGDSGTSSRVFSMIAQQMGDTRYRGKIVWMLLTSRPDLLPIDLKRQGRAEVHIPLFYPETEEEIRAMFVAMAKKNKSPVPADEVPEVAVERRLSGADIESVVMAARRLALVAGRDGINRADLEQSLAEFIPSAQGLEKELQEIAAVLECTQQAFLTDEWRKRVNQPGGRAALQERLVAIRQILEE